MKRLLPPSIAIYGSAALLSATIILHVFILTGLLPRDIVWGGNMVSDDRFYTGEIVSVLFNLYFLLEVCFFAGWISPPKIRIGLYRQLWLTGIFFILNTIGNLLAEQSLERWLFTPVTFLLALFFFRMASSAKENAALKAAQPLR